MELVYIQLDKLRELKFGNKAMIQFKEMAGKDILTVMQEMEENNKMDILLFNQMLFCALQSKNKDIETIEQVIDLVDEYLDIETLIKKCMEAFEKSGFFSNTNSKTSKKLSK